jgi:DNA (cytosine-5)-methyltransferase 1
MKPPSATNVFAARAAAGMTQTEAAAVVHAALRAWQAWEAQGKNRRQMPAGLWELYLLKTGQPVTE